MTKKEFLKQLYTVHDLVQEDVYVMKKKDKKTGKIKEIPIITRSGIEKVQNKNNIKVAFETIYCDLDGVILKAVSMRFDANADEFIPIIETYGSATIKNCKIHFLVETAEARALARVVIKTMKWPGVYGEAEIEGQPTGSLNSFKNE
tara:strand:- start:6894 stop:7334 length:441 start_codon:yes stop_codon:yes gene_type:complete